MSLQQFVHSPTKSVHSTHCRTTHLKTVVGVIAPFLTSLFNKSLLGGFVPDAFKVAYITLLVQVEEVVGVIAPFLTSLFNRPISTEAAGTKCSKAAHCVFRKSALLPRLQSAYRTGHSSERVVLKVL